MDAKKLAVRDRKRNCSGDTPASAQLRKTLSFPISMENAEVTVTNFNLVYFFLKEKKKMNLREECPSSFLDNERISCLFTNSKSFPSNLYFQSHFLFTLSLSLSLSLPTSLLPSSFLKDPKENNWCHEIIMIIEVTDWPRYPHILDYTRLVHKSCQLQQKVSSLHRVERIPARLAKFADNFAEKISILSPIIPFLVIRSSQIIFQHPNTTHIV